MAAKIHKFSVFDKKIVIDVNSGSVFEVDDIVFDALDYRDMNLKNDEIIRDLCQKYLEDDIKEALKEIDTLKEQGFLFTEANFEMAMNKLQSRHDIKALCLNVAHDCNLRCKYCFASKGDYHGSRELMSKEVGKKAVDFLIQNSGNRKNLEIDFFGGEPLMAFETVKEVVSYARKVEKTHNKNINFTITTNAMMLKDEMVQFLHENMTNIVLSLDGRKEVNDFIRVRVDGTGSYDQIVSNIKKIVALRERDGEEYYVRGTFTKHNLDFAQDAFHMADLGFKEISIEPVVGKDGDYLLEEGDLEVLYNQYNQIAQEYLERKQTQEKPFTFYHFNVDIYNGPCIYKRLWACGAGRDYLAITPSGDIYPCHQFVGVDDLLMGNIFTGSLRQDIIDRFHDTHVFAKAECAKCWARFFCSGGCNANNLLINDDMNKPYKITCELQKKRIEYAIYLSINAGAGEKAINIKC